MSFKDMKKRSSDNTSRLIQELDKMNKGSESYKDDRFWKPEIDKSGNGHAVIRFLPPVEGEDVPWVRVFSHGFQGKGGWFIENCPTTLGLKCPVCEANGELWNSGNDKDKDVARDRKRKLSYISNIIVVSDPKHPENEGKVFLYKYGKKIFDKIMEKIQPEFPDETPVNVYDFWKGANFKLKIRNVAGYVNYDKSEFEEPSALMEGNDARLEKLWNSQYKLSEFVAPDKFKSYDELKKKFDSVLNSTRSSVSAENMEDTPFETSTEQEETSSFKAMKAKSPPESKPKAMPEKKAALVDSDEEEDASSYFNRLMTENE